MKTNKMFDPSSGLRRGLSGTYGRLWNRFGMDWWAFQFDHVDGLR